MELEGAVVAVTGGGSGIGAALCRGFAAAGARLVVVADRDLTAALAVATALPVSAIALEVDVTVTGQLEDLVAQALVEGGRLDVLCANAACGAGWAWGSRRTGSRPGGSMSWGWSLRPPPLCPR